MATAMLLPVAKTHEYRRMVNRHHNLCILLSYTECTLNTMFIAVTMDHQTTVYNCHVTICMCFLVDDI